MQLRAAIQQYLESDIHIRSSAGEHFKADEINAKFCAIVKALQKNCKPGDIVGVRLPNDYEYFLTILACMYLGITYVPMSIKWPDERISQLIKICEIAQVVNTEWIANKAIVSPEPLASGWQDLDNSILYIMYTSGSTGEPKGVEIPRTAYENFIEWADKEYTSINSEHRLLGATDFTFDVSLMDVAIALTKKVSIFFFDFQANVFRMLAEITDNQINILATVPNNLQMLLDPNVVSRGNVESLQFLFVAGSRFSTGLYEILEQYKDQIAVYNCYGPTEATIYCVFKHLFQDTADLNNGCVTIGKALPGCVAEIVDLDGVRCAAGQEGELVIGGSQLMRGYRNRSDLTQKAFIELDGDKYYKTGDVCFRDADGQSYVVGRIDDTIKTAGFRVNLSNIDSYISKIEQAQASATIAIAHPQKENVLISYIIPASDASESEIRSELGKVLNPYQIPSKIFLVNSLPTTTSGKIAKRELVTMYEASLAP